MKRLLTTGTAPWLATKLARGGETIGVCMLATALLVSDSADDQEICEVFERMAGAVDPLEDLRGFWADVLAEHPWMDGHMGPLLDWLEGPSDAQVDVVRDLATFLSTVSIWGCDSQADGDLLARVIQAMRAIETRTFHLGNFAFYTPEQTALAFLFGLDDGIYAPDGKGNYVETRNRRLPEEGSSFADVWAGSGTRAIGIAMLMRTVGQDPGKVHWFLQEADGMLLALAAVNMVIYSVSEQITLAHDDSHQRAWLAAHAQGLKRQHDLPPAALMEPRW